MTPAKIFLDTHANHRAELHQDKQTHKHRGKEERCTMLTHGGIIATKVPTNGPQDTKTCDEKDEDVGQLQGWVATEGPSVGPTRFFTREFPIESLEDRESVGKGVAEPRLLSSKDVGIVYRSSTQGHENTLNHEFGQEGQEES